MATMQPHANEFKHKIAKILEGGHDNHAGKKALRVALTAITEAIRERQASLGQISEKIPSPTEYFAVTMTAIETAELSHMPQLLNLLSIILPATPSTVLVTKCDMISDVLFQIVSGMTRHESAKGDDRDHNGIGAMRRWTVNCIGSFLQAFDAKTLPFKRPPLARLLTSLLKAAVGKEAKVRRIAHSVLEQLLRVEGAASVRSSAHSPHASCFQFTQGLLAKCLSGSHAAGGQAQAVTVALRVLALLRRILVLMPDKALHTSLRSLNRLPSLRHTLLTTVGTRTLSFVLRQSTRPIPAELLLTIGKTIQEFQPHSNDVGAMQVFARAITAVLTAPTKGSMASLLPTSVQCLVDSITTSSSEAAQAAASSALIRLVPTIFGSAPKPCTSAIESLRDLCKSKAMSSWAAGLPVLTALFDHVAQAGAEQAPRWRSLVAPVLRDGATMLELMQAELADADLAAIEDSDDDEQDGPSSSAAYRANLLHHVMHSAVRAFGVRQFLAVVPIDTDDKASGDSSERLWVLQLLRKTASQASTSLSFFHRALIPIASKHLAKANKMQQKKKHSVEAKHYRSNSMLVWSLLPGFCTAPVTDISSAFKTLGPVLGKALQDKRFPQLPAYVSSGLLNLVKSVTMPEAQASDRAAIGAFGKDFLPLLFTEYKHAHGSWSARPNAAGVLLAPDGGVGQDGSAHTMNALAQCIKCYASVTPPKVVGSLCSILIRKLLTAAKQLYGMHQKAKSAPEGERQALAAREFEELRTACVLMGLAAVMVTHMTIAHLKKLFSIVRAAIVGDSWQLLQKRAYTVLESMCSRVLHSPEASASASSSSTASTSRRMVADIVTLLQDSLVSTTATAKRRRLKCLSVLVTNHGLRHYYGNSAVEEGSPDISPDQAFMSALVSEIVLCTKESNAKARAEGYDLLVALGEDALSSGRGQQALGELLSMVSSSVAASDPHVQSAGVLALSRLLFQFKAEAAVTNGLPKIFQTVLALLRTKSREVVKSVLGFVKVSVGILTIEELRSRLQTIVTALMRWAKDSKNRFKSKVRGILVKLVNRVGPEPMKAVMPEEHGNLLSHILRETRKKKRNKNKPSKKRRKIGSDESETSEEEEDSDDRSSMPAAGLAQRHQQDKKWLRDDVGGSALDLLDNKQMAKRMRSTLPRSRPSRPTRMEDEFEVAPDGRFIIPADDGDDDAMDVDNAGAPATAALKAATAATAKFKGKHADSTAEQVVGGSGRSDMLQRRKRKRLSQVAAGKSGLHSGNRYKATKAKGDVKRKGTKHQPYSYIRMEAKFLNKKNKKKSLARFQSRDKSTSRRR